MPSATHANAWEAMRQPRFLFSRWPWRALLHTAATLVIWVTFMIPALGVVVPIGAAIDRLVHGQVLAAAALLLLGLVLGGLLLPIVATPLIALDRWRAPLIDPTPLPPSPRSRDDPAAWLRDRWFTATRWREGSLGRR